MLWQLYVIRNGCTTFVTVPVDGVTVGMQLARFTLGSGISRTKMANWDAHGLETDRYIVPFGRSYRAKTNPLSNSFPW